MINLKNNPVEWALMGYELDEVKEHLESLISYMNRNGEIDESEFEVQIFHAITHLNRIYNSKDHVGEITPEDSKKYSEHPVEFEPFG